MLFILQVSILSEQSTSFKDILMLQYSRKIWVHETGITEIRIIPNKEHLTA